MSHFFEVHEKSDCTKCLYSRRIPLSIQLNCTHPLAKVQRNLGATTHEQPFGQCRSTLNFSRPVPVTAFRR